MIKGYILSTYRIESVKGLNLRSSTKGAITAVVFFFFFIYVFCTSCESKTSCKSFYHRPGIESALTVDSYDGHEFETSMDS